jgi:hypothetical protein
MSIIRDLLDRWAHQRDELARLGALVDGAKLVAEHLAQLAEVGAAEAETSLTLKEAAIRSGYAPEYLARLIRQGRIPQAGAKGRPRLYAKDLPCRRSTRVAQGRKRVYDVDADARTLRDWRQ